MTDIVYILRNPPSGTEAWERNIMAMAAYEIFMLRDSCGQLIDMYDFNKLSDQVCDEDNDLVEYIRDIVKKDK